MNQKITFNGKTYGSLDEMPPGERKAYEAINAAFADPDPNGVPDLFEGATRIHAGSAPAKIIYEGRMYESLDELPPEARLKYQAAMAKLDADGNGIPDFVEGIFGMQAGAKPGPLPDWLAAGLQQKGQAFPSSPPSPAINSAPNIEPEGINWRAVIISLVLVAVLLLGAVTLWVYLAQ